MTEHNSFDYFDFTDEEIFAAVEDYCSSDKCTADITPDNFIGIFSQNDLEMEMKEHYLNSIGLNEEQINVIKYMIEFEDVDTELLGILHHDYYKSETSRVWGHLLFAIY